MEKKESRNNLGYLGVEFQYRLVNAFFTQQGFFADLNNIIDQNMFTEQYLRGIVAIMKEYFGKYNSMPSYDMVSIKINEKSMSSDDRQFYVETIDKIKNVHSDGHSEIEDMAERFFKQQNLIKVANNLKKVASDGDISRYDECQKMLEDALAIGRRTNNMSKPFENIDSDLSPQAVTTIPTGIEKLDEALGGGLDKGKVGLIICAMGSGKTTLTTCISANAAISLSEKNNYEGYKVLQFVFEDKPRDIHRKYISKVAQIEQRTLSESDERINEVKSILNCSPERELINNNIRIVKLETGEESASTIKERIKKSMNEGFKPDMVVIDYFECIAPEPGTSRDDITTREGKTMRKFENMADELDIALWIPTQGNRESISTELITNDKVGGSIRKNQIAQVVLSITRSVDDLKNKRAKLAILKNRTGEAGLTLNSVMFDNGTCTITTSDVINFDSSIDF